MGYRILLVDDDALLRRSLTFNLEKAGHQVNAAASAEDGLAQARCCRPDVVLLDIGLPGMDGLEAVRSFENELKVPVIFLTARRRELDQVLGLEMGADDYVTKPFDMDVLLARIKAVMRRSQSPASSSETGGQLTVGDMVIDPSAHSFVFKGQPVELTPREFDLLHALALEAGHVLSVDDLLTRVWGPEYAGEPQVVYVHIRWLREKIEEDPQHPHRILTIRGVGYKLEPQGA
jgi:DNA-binding response OmpR family regulator